jgi:hypothetical protein
LIPNFQVDPEFSADFQVDPEFSPDFQVDPEFSTDFQVDHVIEEKGSFHDERRRQELLKKKYLRAPKIRNFFEPKV